MHINSVISIAWGNGKHKKYVYTDIKKRDNVFLYKSNYVVGLK